MAETVRVTSISENLLCTRLQKKFAGRGAASAGSKAVKGAYEAIKNSKIVAAANPFEETGEFVRAGQTRKVSTAYKAAETVKSAPAKVTHNANAYNASYEKTATFERATYAKAYARAAGVRAAAADFNATTRQMPKVKTTKAAKNNSKEKFNLIEWFKAFVAGDAAEEKTVRSTPISKGLVLSAVVIALIVILMLFSIAQINEFKSEISQLESQRTTLLTKIDDLNVAIDAKNDIRVIEEEATSRIGLVKSNQVATKYVSISDGERVEVVDASEGNESEYGVFGTLMSVMGSNWDHLMEYIN